MSSAAVVANTFLKGKLMYPIAFYCTSYLLIYGIWGPANHPVISISRKNYMISYLTGVKMMQYRGTNCLHFPSVFVKKVK